MKPEEYKRFIVWHEKMSRSNFDFDFKQETIKYCRNDVSNIWAAMGHQSKPPPLHLRRWERDLSGKIIRFDWLVTRG